LCRFFCKFFACGASIILFMANHLTVAEDGDDTVVSRSQGDSAGRFAQGDDCAFDQIVAEHQESVTKLADRLIGWQSNEVEDVVQDVFLAVFKNLSRFRRQSSVKTWLMRITVNKCRSWQRKRLLKLKLLANVPIGQKDSRSSDKDVLDKESCSEVGRAVRNLPQRLREVVVMRYLENMQIEQISEVLSVSRRAVDTRLSRARKQLKEKLADYYV